MRFSLSSIRRGFTLIEMLVAMTVLIVLLGLIVAVTNSVSTTMRRASAGIDALAGARAGFDTMNRTLAQATLNTYWDYDNPVAPTVYLRQSDLQFLIRQNVQNAGYGQEVYFAAPESYTQDSSLRSTRGLLNACGFFVRFDSSKAFQPTTIGGEKYRYRLMCGIQPTESLGIYKKPVRVAADSDSVYRAKVQAYWDSRDWITPIANSGTTGAMSPLAENVIALIAWPRLSGTEDAAGTKLTPDGKFVYDSQSSATVVPQKITANQLPPVIQVTMIAISEAAAARLENGATPPADIEQALAGRFTDVTKYQSDLDAVRKALSDKRIEHQVFNTAVPLRESKWSKAQ